MTRRVLAVGAVIVVVLVAVLAAAVLYAGGGIPGLGGSSTVETGFDDGPEGWTVAGDAQGESAEPTHREAGGNPGGYLSATDDVTGGVWYWNASTRYLGDRSGYYGGTLSFDLNQSSTSSQFDAPDVVLRSEDAEVYYEFDSHPGTNWTGYEVPLTEEGWRDLETDETVTEEGFRAVLSELDALWIRGEYRTGSDVGGIDNVVMEKG